MQDIIIVCAGSTAHEVYGVLENINEHEQEQGRPPKYNVLGFIDDNPNAVLEDYVEAKIIGNISDWQPIGDEVYALGNSQPETKEKLAALLESRGCRFETIIGPYSRVKPHVKIGRGCFITAYCINNGAVIGDFVNIQGSMIGGHTQMGDFSTALGFANIPNAKVGTRALIGSQAVILGHSVGDDATVCAGSVVVGNVKPGTKVFGNPAKKVNF